jgi:hypothetical protein
LTFEIQRVNFLSLTEILLKGGAGEDRMQSELECFHEVVREKMLLSFPFESVHDYLELLEAATKQLGPFGKRACIFLAAAVSDFYIPREKVSVCPSQLTARPLSGLYSTPY